MKMHPVQLVGSMAIVLLGLGCSPGAPVPVDRAADAVDSLRTEWDMKAYQFVTLTRNPDRPDLDSAVLADIMTGHLAHLDSLYAAGIIRLVGRLETIEIRAAWPCSTFQTLPPPWRICRSTLRFRRASSFWTAAPGGGPLPLTSPGQPPMPPAP